MAGQTILLIALNFILSLGLSFFLYQNKLKDKNKWWLAILRFLSFFIIGLILIELSTEKKSISTEKPQLLVAVDNSESIAYLGDTTQVKSATSFLKAHQELNHKFDLNLIKFGKDVNLLDTLSFDEQQTNLSKVVDFYQSDYSDNTAFVLMSDGHQTVGSGYTYELQKTNPEQNYALVVGDTTQHPDLSIEMLNVNQYAFLNNKFPVEVFVNYQGDQAVSKKLILSKDNQKIRSEQIDLKPNSALSHTFYVNANALGNQDYNVNIEALSDEYNTENNKRVFGVDVIDNRHQILILSDMVHPDIGALKASIESNQQNQVHLKSTSEVSDLEKYSLVIFYQPQESFNSTFEAVLKRDLNFMVILGTETDYKFVNSLNLGFSKPASGVNEDYFASQNSDFSLYQYQDINFESFPPLESDFGRLKVSDKAKTILMTKINNVKTDAPLFFILQDGQHKRSVLGAENLWKWKTKSYRNTSDFENFNTFINQHVQFLASNDPKQRLEISSESFYNQGVDNEIKAQYYDANFRFDPNATLELKFKNKNTNATFSSQMLVKNQRYTANISQLAPGEYQASLTKGDFRKEVSFQVLAYSPEKISKTANIDAITQSFSKNQIFLFDDTEAFVLQLLASENYYNIQISHTKPVLLIEIKYLLIILVLLLSVEWFARKYFGLI